MAGLFLFINKEKNKRAGSWRRTMRICALGIFGILVLLEIAIACLGSHRLLAVFIPITSSSSSSSPSAPSAVVVADTYFLHPGNSTAWWTSSSSSSSSIITRRYDEQGPNSSSVAQQNANAEKKKNHHYHHHPASPQYSWNDASAAAVNFEIDRILYFNSFVRPVNNRFMESWLMEETRRPIPYYRIEVIKGLNVQICRRKVRCRNDRMAAFTYQYIARHGGLLRKTAAGSSSSTTSTTSSNVTLNSSARQQELIPDDQVLAVEENVSSSSSTFNPGLPFGNRPSHDPGKPYYNLSGTTMVIHEDNIRIPSLDHLRSVIAQAMEQGLISSQHWEVIRLECCRDGPEALAIMETHPTLGESDISTNTSWTIHEQTAGVLIWRDTALQTFGHQIVYDPDRYQNFINVENRIAQDFYSYSLGTCLCRFQEFEDRGQGLLPKKESSSSSSNNVTASTTTTKPSVVSMLITPLQRMDDPLETKVSLERIQQEIARLRSTSSSLQKQQQQQQEEEQIPRYNNAIDHVYYSNLEKNKVRRKAMEFWMDNDPLLRTTHKQRINAIIGEPPIDQCVPAKNDPRRCRGLAGITRTLLSIMKNENTTGLTLVLEDDYVITDPGLQRMRASLELVPDDWELIRFDCTQTDQVHLQWLNPFVANTTTLKFKSDCDRSVPNHMCWFCGGAYAMLWREDSIPKLRAMWGRIPYDDVDCVIARTKSVRSYCVNVGVGNMFIIDSEVSDIPKINSKVP